MTFVNPEISCIRMGSGSALFGLARFYCIIYNYYAFVHFICSHIYEWVAKFWGGRVMRE